MTSEFDPLDPRNLQSRARMLLARAGRMQDLHGQTQATALAQRSVADAAGTPAAGTTPGDLHPDRMLAQSAAQAVNDTHRSLLAAAAQASQAARTDPVIARLNAGIHGMNLLAGTVGAVDDDVVDVTAVEMPKPPPPGDPASEPGDTVAPAP